MSAPGQAPDKRRWLLEGGTRAGHGPTRRDTLVSGPGLTFGESVAVAPVSELDLRRVADARVERRKVIMELTGVDVDGEENRCVEAVMEILDGPLIHDVARVIVERIASLLAPEGEGDRCTCVRTEAGVMPVGVSPDCPVHVPSPSSEPARDGRTDVDDALRGLLSEIYDGGDAGEDRDMDADVARIRALLGDGTVPREEGSTHG